MAATIKHDKIAYTIYNNNIALSLPIAECQQIHESCSAESYSDNWILDSIFDDEATLSLMKKISPVGWKPVAKNRVEKGKESPYVWNRWKLL